MVARKVEDIASDAQFVLLHDHEDKRYYGDITLGISEDFYVHYNNKQIPAADSSPSNRFRLDIEGYCGKILMPKYSVLEIHSDREIRGRLAYASVILGKGDVDLTIEQDSGLELCIEMGSGVLIMNNRPIMPEKKGDLLIYGRDIRDITSRYRTFNENIMNKKIPLPNKYIQEEYFYEKDALFTDICQAYNLVYIQKDQGNVNIEYKDHEKKIRNNQEVFMTNIRFLNTALKKAVYEEDYKKAAKIKDNMLACEKVMHNIKKNYITTAKDFFARRTMNDKDNSNKAATNP